MYYRDLVEWRLDEQQQIHLFGYRLLSLRNDKFNDFDTSGIVGKQRLD